jgi:hypothetical protein
LGNNLAEKLICESNTAEISDGNPESTQLTAADLGFEPLLFPEIREQANAMSCD